MKSMETLSCREIAAIDGGEAGAAFLGSQGDEWDAQELRARNLILYHTEDRTLETRSERYANEAREVFTGSIIVPDDLQTIPLD